jgi:hypothetical protein
MTDNFSINNIIIPINDVDLIVFNRFMVNNVEGERMYLRKCPVIEIVVYAKIVCHF